MSTTASTIVYPVARRDESISDDFHGTVVADPYRWLEDPDAPETAAFVDAQNAISKPYLEQPAVRQQLSDKVTALWNYPKYSAPARRGNNYFHYANSGLQNQSVLYKQVGSLEAEPSVFLDPNTLSADGTIALSNTAFSDDGQYFAYGLSESGSDWNKIKVKNVDTGADYPECLERIKFSGIAWTKDNKGFFYSVSMVYAYFECLMFNDGDDSNSAFRTKTAKRMAPKRHRTRTRNCTTIVWARARTRT